MVYKNEREKQMFDKLLNVFAKNLGYTIVLVVTIILFLYFSEGLIEGLIAAVAAVIAFACIMALYKAYKATPAPVKKTAPAKKTATVKATKKTSAKKK